MRIKLNSWPGGAWHGGAGHGKGVIRSLKNGIIIKQMKGG